MRGGELLRDLQFLDRRCATAAAAGRPSGPARPSACMSSRRRRMTSRLKPIRKRTSSGDRFQFSVENAYADRWVTPISMAPSTTSNRAASPRLCPSVRGSPRCLRPAAVAVHHQCDVPGDGAGGSAGGRAPLGCGVGRRGTRGPSMAGRALPGRSTIARPDRPAPVDHRQRPQPALQVPLQQRGDQPGGLPAAARRSDASATAQSPSASAAISSIVAGAGRAAPTDPAPRQSAHSSAAGGDVEGGVRTGRAAAGALGQRRRPAGQHHRPQQERVQDQRRVPGRSRSAPAAPTPPAGTAAATAPAPPTVSRSAVSTIAVAQVYRG